MKKRQANQIRKPVLAAALALLAPLCMAQTQVVVTDAHARGLSVQGVDTTSDSAGYAVRARVSRGLMHRVLAPVTLQVVIRDESGVVKAQQDTLLGPAQLPRGRLRSFSFESRFEQAPAAGDVVEVSLSQRGG